MLYFIIPCGELGSPNLGKAAYSSRTSSATHSYEYVQYFRLSKQRYGCQCLGFLTCAQMLMHAVAHGGCANTVRKSALKVDPGRKIPCHTGDSNPSALRLAFRPDAATREQTTAVRGCQRKLMHYSAGFVSIKQRWSSKGLCSCPSAGQRPHGVVW